jgi:hypothetical protein
MDTAGGGGNLLCRQRFQRQGHESADTPGKLPVGRREGLASRRQGLDMRRIGNPQCAVVGWPGQIGQASPAAEAQTVKMKSISGAPGAANSSHDLLRASGSGTPCLSRVSSATGFTVPDGWLPAEYAVKRPPPR